MKFLIPFLVFIYAFKYSYSQTPAGSGMIFNGTSDYYTVTDNSSIDLSGNFTIEAWINPCDTSSHTMILTKLWCSGGRFSFYFSIFNGKLKWYWNSNGSCGGPANNSYESNAVIIRNNEWQHVAVVHTPTSVTLYYNGAPVLGSLVTGVYSGLLHNSNQPLRVGAYRYLAGGFSNFFNGRMDEIRCWSSALTSSQIASRYNSPLTGSETNLNLYHNFESIVGNVISNSATTSGTINNGLNVNGSPVVFSNLTNYPSEFYLGNDTILCQPDSLLVSIPLGYSQYLWTDGTTSRNKIISSSGTYIGIGYKDFCFAKDTILVSIINCDTSIIDTSSPAPIDTCEEKFIMPNVFSPNNDGVNDLFKPILYECYDLISFKIYNRWGQIVFESSNNIGWNGKSNSKVVSDGAYFWTIEHRNSKGEVELGNGVITIF